MNEIISQRRGVAMAQGGGGVDYLKLLLDNELESYNIKSNSIKAYIFTEATALKNVTLPPVLVSIGNYAFQNSGIEGIHIHKVTTIGSSTGAGYVFKGSKIAYFILEESDAVNGPFNATHVLYNCSYLEVLDFGNIQKLNGTNLLNGSMSCNKIILRKNTVIPLYTDRVFQNTVFSNGGAGGTIYIPKSLYDHLGDGTSSDYKAATNWSTIDGYDTITWAKIEGSDYDGYWADGTPIPQQ